MLLFTKTTTWVCLILTSDSVAHRIMFSCNINDDWRYYDWITFIEKTLKISVFSMLQSIWKIERRVSFKSLLINYTFKKCSFCMTEFNANINYLYKKIEKKCKFICYFIEFFFVLVFNSGVAIGRQPGHLSKALRSKVVLKKTLNMGEWFWEFSFQLKAQKISEFYKVFE